MGQQHQFICPKCSYEAIVSGGFDCGMRSAFLTISCRDCAELFDALLDRLPAELLLNDEPAEDDVGALACPNNADHAISLWTDPGSCPKCGHKMKRGMPGPLWD